MVNRNLDKTAGDFYPGYRHPKLLIGIDSHCIFRCIRATIESIFIDIMRQ